MRNIPVHKITTNKLKNRDVPQILYCTRNHPLPDGHISLLGAIDSVTPTIHLLELDGARFLVDCGPIKKNSAIPIDDIEAVILTHAHQDHTGGIPDLIKSGYKGPIFATPATVEIAGILLQDSIRINGGKDNDVQFFLTAFNKQTVKVNYGEKFFPIENRNINALFHEAGHILGSASIEIISDQSRIIISGDLGRPGSPILRDYNRVWGSGRAVDLVMIETTYGGVKHETSIMDVEEELEEIIKRAVMDRGHILVPAFAIGRTQTLLYFLNNLVESGRIKNLPVALDTPMGLKITKTYETFKRLFDKEALEKIAKGDDPLDFHDLYAVHNMRDSVRLRDIKEPLLIIAGSGMCTGGRILGHLADLLPLPETNLVFIGHQAKGTLGQIIQDSGNNEKTLKNSHVFINKEKIQINAHVDTLHGISAHADREELGAWLNSIPGIKRIALYHGEKHSQKQFADYFGNVL